MAYPAWRIPCHICLVGTVFVALSRPHGEPLCGANLSNIARRHHCPEGPGPPALYSRQLLGIRQCTPRRGKTHNRPLRPSARNVRLVELGRTDLCRQRPGFADRLYANSRRQIEPKRGRPSAARLYGLCEGHARRARAVLCRAQFLQRF